jgi:hypothetical protein
MYCTVIHCAAYVENSFIANYQAARVSILLTEKIYYVLSDFIVSLNYMFALNRADDIL